MAVMYPRHLPDNKAREKKGLPPISEAERTLFSLFRDHLPDNYTVFHGVRLQSPRRSGGIDDLEVDFVLAHPEHGLLVLEVKGGLIRFDGSDWTSTDRYGQTHPITPFEQAHTACYALGDHIRKQASLTGYDYTYWYAVAFPHVVVDDDLSPGVPRATILDQTDCLRSGITDAMERIWAHYRRAGHKGPGKKGIREFKRVLARHWFLRPTLAADMAHEEEALHELTEQQYNLLEFLGDQPRALIAGCAGSGKTMLAMEKARRLTQGGKRVLFTCYNKELATALNERFPDEGITIQHFHSLAHSVTKQAGQPLKWLGDLDDMEADHYWKVYVPEKLFEAAASLPEAERYDGIIVDEGQDFQSTYWEAVQMLLKDPDGGHLYIFYDDSQRLYSEAKFPLPDDAGKLTKNLRSTREIGDLVSRYYTGDSSITAAGPQSGRKVELVKAKDEAAMQQALADQLGVLADEGVSMRDVIVLTPRSEKSSLWQHRMQVGEFELDRKRLKRKKRRVRVETIQGFKGLERPVVILTELDKIGGESEEDDRSEAEQARDHNQLMYVALSRAKNHVIVIGQLPEPKEVPS